MFKRSLTFIRRLLRPRRKASLQQVAECRVILIGPRWESGRRKR